MVPDKATTRSAAEPMRATLVVFNVIVPVVPVLTAFNSTTV